MSALIEHHKRLTAAVREALALDSKEEAGAVLRDALDSHGFQSQPRQGPASVGTCSRCEGPVFLDGNGDYRCDCGETYIPRSFRAPVTA